MYINRKSYDIKLMQIYLLLYSCSTESSTNKLPGKLFTKLLRMLNMNPFKIVQVYIIIRFVVDIIYELLCY